MTRFGYVMLAYFAAMGTIITAFINPAPRLIWNASASVPIGLYVVHRGAPAPPGALVLVTPPEPLARYMAERHYLPRGVPMLKHVAAIAGQRVCRTGVRILLDGEHLGDARLRDSRGRLLPVWSGCHVLAGGEVFLMNADVPDSLDGRYFGPLAATTLGGTLTPIWLRANRAPGEAESPRP